MFLRIFGFVVELQATQASEEDIYGCGPLASNLQASGAGICVDSGHLRQDCKPVDGRDEWFRVLCGKSAG